MSVQIARLSLRNLGIVLCIVGVVAAPAVSATLLRSDGQDPIPTFSAPQIQVSYETSWGQFAQVFWTESSDGEFCEGHSLGVSREFEKSLANATLGCQKSRPKLPESIRLGVRWVPNGAGQYSVLVNGQFDTSRIEAVRLSGVGNSTGRLVSGLNGYFIVELPAPAARNELPVGLSTAGIVGVDENGREVARRALVDLAKVAAQAERAAPSSG